MNGFGKRLEHDARKVKRAFIITHVIKAFTCIAVVGGIWWFSFKVLEYLVR